MYVIQFLHLAFTVVASFLYFTAALSGWRAWRALIAAKTTAEESIFKTTVLYLIDVFTPKSHKGWYTKNIPKHQASSNAATFGHLFCVMSIAIGISFGSLNTNYIFAHGWNPTLGLTESSIWVFTHCIVALTFLFGHIMLQRYAKDMAEQLNDGK